MADIYQIPESGNTPQFTIPIGGMGNGGFGFGNGMNGIVKKEQWFYLYRP